MTEVDVAWAAGLFEGEGSIGLKRAESGRTYPKLQVNTTDEDVLRRFHEIVGGGTFHGPYAPKRIRWKPFFLWTVSGTEARRIGALLAPFLGERRAARLAEVLAEASEPLPGARGQRRGAAHQLSIHTTERRSL